MQKKERSLNRPCWVVIIFTPKDTLGNSWTPHAPPVSGRFDVRALVWFHTVALPLWIASDYKPFASWRFVRSLTSAVYRRRTAPQKGFFFFFFPRRLTVAVCTQRDPAKWRECFPLQPQLLVCGVLLRRAGTQTAAERKRYVSFHHTAWRNEESSLQQLVGCHLQMACQHAFHTLAIQQLCDLVTKQFFWS